VKRLVAVLAAALLLCSSSPASARTDFFLQGRRVYLTHPAPHSLRLHHGGAWIAQWWTRCVPHYPHVTSVWYTWSGDVTTDYAELWYCGARHVKHWRVYG
jgi:hypothetical protein